MRSMSLVLVALASMSHFVAAIDPKEATVGGKRTLVIVEDREMASSHSILLS